MFTKKCGAETKGNTPCKQPAMPNGKCRFHGGESSYYDEKTLKIAGDLFEARANMRKCEKRLYKRLDRLAAMRKKKADKMKINSVQSNHDQN
jgi:hypothetical protein